MQAPKIIPSSPNFSSGPTKKPDSWSLNKINDSYLGRYHRSGSVLNYLKSILKDLKMILNIPKEYELILTPGSCTGAMQSIIWSILGERKITGIVYDFWGEQWSKDILSLNYEIEIRKEKWGYMPLLKEINKNDDITFVWTGTSLGMSVNNTKWISDQHDGLVISDVTSAVFMNDIDWEKIDISVFSWQKALGSEGQHGLVVISPKAKERLKEKKKIKKNIFPKILDISNLDTLINTPSVLCMSDFKLCLEWFKKKGGLSWGIQKCKENYTIIENWMLNNNNLRFFCEDKRYRSTSSSFLVPNKAIKKSKLKKIFAFLESKRIAYDINSYRKAPLGIRIWTGPTILKKDLIALTNWLDWSFYKF